MYINTPKNTKFDKPTRSRLVDCIKCTSLEFGLYYTVAIPLLKNSLDIILNAMGAIILENNLIKSLNIY
jgi:hypothetical protein